jgi:hypothetical protein
MADPGTRSRNRPASAYSARFERSDTSTIYSEGSGHAVAATNTGLDTDPNPTTDAESDGRIDSHLWTDSRPDARIDSLPDARIDSLPDARIDSLPDARSNTEPYARGHSCQYAQPNAQTEA